MKNVEIGKKLWAMVVKRIHEKNPKMEYHQIAHILGLPESVVRNILKEGGEEEGS